ncbi:MAG: hypothetical protein IKK29_03675 [Christensenellaceae bacterium]|nr:hypothetical protein [Christensenellaceae bacterium]
MNIQDAVLENSKELEKNRDELDRLAEEALRQGKSLGEDERVLRMAREVDVLVLKEIELQKMLEEYEKEEAAE